MSMTSSHVARWALDVAFVSKAASQRVRSFYPNMGSRCAWVKSRESDRESGQIMGSGCPRVSSSVTGSQGKCDGQAGRQADINQKGKRKRSPGDGITPL